MTDETNETPHESDETMTTQPPKTIASNVRAHQQAQARQAAPPAPEPRQAAPPAPEPRRQLPATLGDAYAELCRPFSARLVELRIGEVNDYGLALAIASVDMCAYQRRLDRVVGPAAWRCEIDMGQRGVVCKLTILGVTRSAVGDYGSGENGATVAEARAFKRACAAFGLGRYLYALPQLWVDFDAATNEIRNPSAVVAEMYAEANIDERTEA